MLFSRQASRERTKNRKKLKLELEAVDEGGPSREFFQKVWKQMGCLKVGSKRLFPVLSKAGYVPMEDTALEELGIDGETKARAFFRAIGRMMSHCILLSERNHGPITIAHSALPKLYQSLLLSGLSPENPIYNSSALVDHARDLIEKDNLIEYLGLEETDDPNRALRDSIKDMYVESRKIATKSLREGLSIGGFVDWQTCFGLYQSSALTRIMFAKDKITEDDLFVEGKGWRFIKFEQEEFPENGEEDKEIWDNRIEAFKETQAQFQENLEELFRTKVREGDSEFLNDFVWQCTGQSYLPDASLIQDFNFYITIEFNYSELGEGHLPGVHSCGKLTLLTRTTIL